jgi:hypothetical protein
MANSSWTIGAGLIGVGALPAAGVIPNNPNTASTMWASTAKGVTIGDTAGGEVAGVRIAAVLTFAAAGSTVVVAHAVRAAIRGVAASVVFAGPAGATSLELPITGAGDAADTDEAVSVPLGFLSAAAVGINGAVGVEVAGVEVTVALVRGESALVGFAFAAPELLTDGDGR